MREYVCVCVCACVCMHVYTCLSVCLCVCVFSAAVCGFEAFINGKHIVGEVKEKEQAHREYKEAISKGHGAYLMDEDEETPVRGREGEGRGGGNHFAACLNGGHNQFCLPIHSPLLPATVTCSLCVHALQCW